MSCTTSKSPVKSSAARPQGFTHLGVELSRLSSRVIAGAACTETTSKITKRLPNPESQIEHNRNDYVLIMTYRVSYILFASCLRSSIYIDHVSLISIDDSVHFSFFLFYFILPESVSRVDQLGAKRRKILVGKRGKSSWINLYGIISILLFPIHGQLHRLYVINRIVRVLRR